MRTQAVAAPPQPRRTYPPAATAQSPLHETERPTALRAAARARNAFVVEARNASPALHKATSADRARMGYQPADNFADVLREIYGCGDGN